jgi:uncharacterized protein YdeI (YjbR/CyaY-like superfamily)
VAKKDKRIDAYIEKAQPFAKPILKHLRKLVHQGCPEVTETVKWGMPSFDYKGPFCSMASFKQHAVFGFWKFKLIKDPKNYLGNIKADGGEAMGNMGRITSLKDLPPDSVILGFIKQAIKLNDDDVKMEKTVKNPATSKNTTAPADFMAALKKNKKAIAVWTDWTPGKKKEYVQWIVEAKSDETRASRIQKAVEWISERKIRNWKYMKK